jgi:acetyl esterase/lipase
VADSRAALRWVQDHAAELGIDAARIVVGGHSAGGHVALWTAIDKTPPGSNPAEAPTAKPAALFLLAPVSDTSPQTGYTPFRFGANALALSPVHQLDGKMPPTLLMHADTDEVVPYRESVALNAALLKNGAVCDFITVPHGKHSFPWQTPGWDEKVIMDKLVTFLKKNGILPAASASLDGLRPRAMSPFCLQACLR